MNNGLNSSFNNRILTLSYTELMVFFRGMDYVEEIELMEESEKYIEWLSYFFVAEM